MGKASRTKSDVDRRARIAAQREAERRRTQRKRMYLAGGSILVVAIVVVAVVLVALNKKAPTASAAPTGAALTALIKQVEDVPSSVTDKVGSGGGSTAGFVQGHTTSQIGTAAGKGNYFATVDSTTKLTSGGKPELLFIGGQYCPFCAAERWAMVNALSRFGTFTGLSAIHSSSTDTDPNTPSFDFSKASYTSKYLAFTPVEEFGATSSTILQKPTAAQQALATSYDPQGGIPFLDFGNQYVEDGNISPLDPSTMSGKTWAQIGTDIASPTGNAVGTAEIGNANYITAAICKMTNNLPATACTPAIQTLQQAFAS
jgi:hypothetical protein